MEKNIIFTPLHHEGIFIVPFPAVLLKDVLDTNNRWLEIVFVNIDVPFTLYSGASVSSSSL